MMLIDSTGCYRSTYYLARVLRVGSNRQSVCIAYQRSWIKKGFDVSLKLDVPTIVTAYKIRASVCLDEFIM